MIASPHLYNRRIRLSRSIVTKDAAGGLATEIGDTGTGIPANIQPARPAEIQRYAQAGVKVSHTIFVPRDTGASFDDWIVDDRGVRYRVRDAQGMGGREDQFRIHAELTKA